MDKSNDDNKCSAVQLMLDENANIYDFAEALFQDSKNKFDSLLETAEQDEKFAEKMFLPDPSEELISRSQIFAVTIKCKFNYEEDIINYINHKKSKELLNTMMLYWGVYIEAKHIFYSRAYQSKEEENEFIKSMYGKLNAERRLKKDPVQLALKEIEKIYITKKAQFRRRGFSAQFIRDMADKYPVIKDLKTIGKLVSKLNKANDKIPLQLVQDPLS
ncbi:MAG: hypothetical protein ACKE5M_04160 [Methylophilaceae bacterium]